MGSGFGWERSCLASLLFSTVVFLFGLFFLLCIVNIANSEVSSLHSKLPLKIHGQKRSDFDGHKRTRAALKRIEKIAWTDRS